MTSAATHLAVLGSPISHSKSPAIHRAAYAALGLDWTYDAIEMTGAGIGDFMAGLDETWHGLSLTMPLKRDVVPLLAHRDPLVDVVGGANTVLLDADGPRGYNTDVQGVIESFAAVGVLSLGRVHLLGAGATAASVLVAVSQLGASGVLISARTPHKARALVELGATLGVDVEVSPWGEPDRGAAPDAIVSTVPGGATGLTFAESVMARAVLFDVAYDPWPSALALAWDAEGGTVISGLDLLVNQAMGQIRLFVSGDQNQRLADENRVMQAMRAAVA